MENVKIDDSDISIKDEQTDESIREANLKLQEIRKNSVVQMVQRQTDYDIDKTLERLDFWNGNYLNVIKEWLNPNFKTKNEISDNKSKNQMKWGEIRTFMDDVNKKQLLRKRQKEYMEKKKTEYINYLKHKEKIDAETKKSEQ